MAIYRPPRPRWRPALAAAVAGIAVGLLIGWLAFGRSDPDPLAALRRLREAATSAATTLEIVTIEYDESVDGTNVVNDAEYEGAMGALARSRSRYTEFRDAFALVDGASTERIDDAYAALEEQMSQPVPAEAVAARAETLAELLRDLMEG